jgi:hypothetical protein
MYVSRTIPLVLLMFIYKQIIVKIENSVLTVNCNNIQLNSSNTYMYMCFEPLPQAGGGGAQCCARFIGNKIFSLR